MIPLESGLFRIVSSADPYGIAIVSLLLIALFFVAWKAPAWVRETGLAGLTAGIFWTVCEFMAIGYAVQLNEDADPYIVWCAVPIALIPAAYGLLVYFISLIIRMARKPKM